jgi:hypothetical protein
MSPRNALGGWYGEYERQFDLRVQPLARARKNSEAEKAGGNQALPQP